jgi:2-dehydro-3-deoxyphosphogalactonate aldolase
MELTHYLRQCPLIAILRGIKPHEVEPVAAALERSGIAIVEVPLNSPEPVQSIRLLAKSFGERLLIGAGTVLSEGQVAEIASAGGRLIVTPHADSVVTRAAKRHGLLAVPGFFTPAEAFAMLAAGADALKLFPAEAANPETLRALRAVLPAGSIMMPVGGIGPANIPAWRAAGAQGFGIGSAIYRPSDTASIVEQKARELVAALT